MTAATLTLRKPDTASVLMWRAASLAIMDAADRLFDLGDMIGADECRAKVSEVEAALDLAALGLCLGVPLQTFNAADLVDYGESVSEMLRDRVEPEEVGRLAGVAVKMLMGNLPDDEDDEDGASSASTPPAPTQTRPVPVEPTGAKPAPDPMGNLGAPVDDPNLVPPPLPSMSTADLALWQAARWARDDGRQGVERARAAWRFRRAELLRERANG